MKHYMTFSLALTAMLFSATSWAQGPRRSGQNPPVAASQSVADALVGRLRLSRTEAVLDEQRRFKFDPERTQCFTLRGDQALATTCATLVGIGYADQARLTVAGDTVVRLEILELHQ